MKILFFIYGLPPGGKERRLVELMKGLRKVPSIQLDLVLMDQEIHFKEVYDLNITTHFLIRRSKKDISILARLYRLCKKIKPDIVHCWGGMTVIYSLPICKLLKIKLINGMVTNAPEKPNIFNNRDYRRAWLTFPFSDRIIGNSRSGLVTYNAPREKSYCIHNGFNFDRLKFLESVAVLKDRFRVRTDYVIGMVATFSDKKDYKTFFEAAQILLGKRNDITFLVIGANTDSIEVKKMIKDEYREHFRLLGKRSDVESLINLMDITVLATFTEGISNSILEYMALGKPVIATEGGGTNEIVMDGETGFLVPPSDAQKFSDKMDIFLNDASLRYRMGNAGRKRIREHFSIEKMISQYISVYNDLCRN